MGSKRLNILFANGRPMYPFFIGGDGVSIHNLLLSLVKLGFQCHCLGCYDYPHQKVSENEIIRYIFQGVITDYTVTHEEIKYNAGYPCTLVKQEMFETKLRSYVASDFHADIIITQLERSIDVIQVANDNKVKLILNVIDNTPPNFKAISCLSKENSIIFNSEFVKNYFLRRLYISPERYIVIPPVIDWDSILASNYNMKFITMVNPELHKGGDIVQEVARQMKNEHFLIVKPKLPEKYLNIDLESLENVAIKNRKIDMRVIYSQSKLVLVPSRCDECFGMVAIEAQINGIPPIVSDRGALPEVIGDGGIVVSPFDDTKKWVAAIEKSRYVYHELSRKSLANAYRFEQSNVVDQYISFLEDL